MLRDTSLPSLLFSPVCSPSVVLLTPPTPTPTLTGRGPDTQVGPRTTGRKPGSALRVVGTLVLLRVGAARLQAADQGPVLPVGCGHPGLTRCQH